MTSTTGLPETLEPCPFCGSPNLIFREGERRTDGVAGEPAAIICIDCQGRMFGYDLERATAAWNRRPALSASMAGPVPEGWREAIKLRFFRDLDARDRAKVFAVFGIPREAIAEATTHAHERVLLGRVFRDMLAAAPAPALPEAKPVASPAEGAPVAAAILREIGDLAEATRLILVNHLAEPERRAFWNAVKIRDLARSPDVSPDREAATREAVIEDDRQRELQFQSHVLDRLIEHRPPALGTDFVLELYAVAAAIRALAQQAKPQQEKI